MATSQPDVPPPSSFWQTLRLSEIAALFVGFLNVSG